MKNFDRASLLFELLLGTDMINVNRKIDEIRMSDSYVRVANYLPEQSGTQLMKDVKVRFDSLDIFGILSMQRALEVEQEVIELDRRIKNFPSLNPYLATGAEAEYKVKRVGQIAVEISSQGMSLNDFTTHKGVRASNRKKVLKGKVFNWYKEAKKGFVDMIENSKLMLAKIKYSKVSFISIFWQHLIMFLASLAGVLCVFFAKSFEAYREGTLELWAQWGITGGLYLSILCMIISSIVMSHYKGYAFRMASRMKKQVTKQAKMVEALDKSSYQFEKSIINSSKSPRKIRTLISQVAVLKDFQKISSSEIFNYVYSEKEYYHEHHKFGLGLHNVAYAIGFIVAIVAIFVPVIF